MIKKGIELQIISPSQLISVGFGRAFSHLPPGEFKVCKVCRSGSLWLCHLICKYRSATYNEFCEDKKGIKENE